MLGLRWESDARTMVYFLGIANETPIKTDTTDKH